MLQLPDGSLMNITKVYALDAIYDSPEDVPEDVMDKLVSVLSLCICMHLHMHTLLLLSFLPCIQFDLTIFCSG